MASGRRSLTLLCVCGLMVLLLAAHVAAAEADLPQQQPAQPKFTGSRKHLRGDAMEAEEENLESFERRELSDYGTNPAKPNCRLVKC